MAKKSRPILRPEETPLPPDRIALLELERARLQEDVLQLRAAVSIWTEIYLHTVAATRGSQRHEREVG